MQHQRRGYAVGHNERQDSAAVARFMFHCGTCRICDADMRSMRPFCRTGRYLVSALTPSEVHALFEESYASQIDDHG
jgi:hypothetical protein